MSKSKTSKLDHLELRQTPETGKFAAIYVRVSSNELKKYTKQKKILVSRESVLNQEDDGIRIATEHNWDYEVYNKDCNISGIEDEEKRVDYRRLVEDIKAGRIHRIITRDPYRLSRSAKLSSNLLHDVLIPKGVTVIFTDFSIDLTTSEGREAFCSFGWKGQAQLQYISKTSRRGRERLVRTGGFSGKPPFGYRMTGRSTNSVVVDPREKEIVVRVFNDYASKKSVVTICRELTREKVEKRSGKTNWTPCDISRMLRRQQYIGKVTYNGTPYPSPFEPIVDETLFGTVATNLSTNSNNGHRNRMKYSTHLLQGILKCGNCLDVINSGLDETKRYANMTVTGTAKNGITHYYYVCQTQKKDGCATCGMVRVSLPMIEGFVREFLAVSAIAARPSVDRSAHITQLRLEIAESTELIDSASKKKANTIKRFSKQQTLKQEDYEDTLSSLNETIVEAQNGIKQKEDEITRLTDNAAEKALTELQRWDAITPLERRQAIRIACPMMIVQHHAVQFCWASDGSNYSIPLTRGKRGRLYLDVQKSLDDLRSNDIGFSQVALPD